MVMRVMQVRGITQQVDIPEDRLPENNPGWRGGIEQYNTCRYCGRYDWAPNPQCEKHPTK